VTLRLTAALSLICGCSFANAAFISMTSLSQHDSHIWESSEGYLSQIHDELIDTGGSFSDFSFFLHPDNLYLLGTQTGFTLSQNTWTSDEIDLTAEARLSAGQWNYMSETDISIEVFTSVEFESDTDVTITLSQDNVGAANGLSLLIIDGVTYNTGQGDESFTVDVASGSHTVSFSTFIGVDTLPSEFDFGGSISMDYHLNIKQTVPEPASIAALGLGALALLKRRKRS
jgi:hypothetical protein